MLLRSKVSQYMGSNCKRFFSFPLREKKSQILSRMVLCTGKTVTGWAFLRLSLHWSNWFVKIQKKKGSYFCKREPAVVSRGCRSLLLLMWWSLEAVVKAPLRRRHWTGGDGGGLGLRGSGRALFLLKGVLPAAQGGDHAVAELLVHADVDHRVVDGGALGKEGRDGHEDWSKLRALMCEAPPGHTSVG